MVFVETPAFSAWREQHLDDEALRLLQNSLLQNPDQGDVIVHGSGLRKLRWALSGRGKRGGARVIYLLRHSASRIDLLLAYAKNQQDDLTPKQLEALTRIVNMEPKHG